MFNPQTMTSAEIERSGYEFGAELAAALVLASNRAGANNGVKREMAQIVLREIGTAVQGLRRTAVPLLLVAAYEQACRAGVRDELKRSFTADTRQDARHAA